MTRFVFAVEDFILHFSDTLKEMSTPSSATFDASNTRRKRAKITFDSSFSDNTSSQSSRSEEIIDVDELKQNLYKLKKLSKLQKADLQDNDHALMMKVSQSLYTLYHEGDYETSHKIIVETFGSERNSEPGSVGNFFAGCLGDNNFDGNVGCSAECAGNIPMPKGPGISFCDSHVGYYRDGIFDRTYTPIKKSNIILIHQINGKCTLAKDEIEELKALGIEKVVLSIKENGEYKTRSQVMDLEVLLPRKKHVTANKKLGAPQKGKLLEAKDKKGHKEDDKEEHATYWWFIILIVIFFIIVIVCCVGYNSYGNDSSRHQNKFSHSASRQETSIY